MANRLFNPDEQYCDQNGLPYAGGTLSFYTSGTSSPLATYSDKALTVPNTNPVVLDSAGRMGAVFLQNFAYKVVLADVNGATIWTEDPVYSSDFSTIAQIITNAGNPNGVVAGTAGSGTVPSSMVWDSTNNVLYICTATGSAGSAVWTAVNATTAASVVLPPQGYLTLVSGQPVITSDQVGVTSIIYTPFIGNLVPIYNGSTLVPTVFSELTLTLSASHAADTIYDVYVFNNSGVVTVASGPAWGTLTPGSCARGAAAALAKLSGIWVNNISITAKNGANTYTIGANLGTYVGTFYTDHTAGQVSCYVSSGQNRKWGVWNYYNRQPLRLLVSDATASWTYATNTIRASNAVPAAYAAGAFNVGSGTTSNGCVVLQGVAEETYNVSFVQAGQLVANGNTGTCTGDIEIGIGLNSTTAFSGAFGHKKMSSSGLGTVNQNWTLIDDLSAVYPLIPSIGINNLCALETCISTANCAQTFFGTTSQMTLSVTWRG